MINNNNNVLNLTKDKLTIEEMEAVLNNPNENLPFLMEEGTFVLIVKDEDYEEAMKLLNNDINFDFVSPKLTKAEMKQAFVSKYVAGEVEAKYYKQHVDVVSAIYDVVSEVAELYQAGTIKGLSPAVPTLDLDATTYPLALLLLQHLIEEEHGIVVPVYWDNLIQHINYSKDKLIRDNVYNNIYKPLMLENKDIKNYYWISWDIDFNFEALGKDVHGYSFHNHFNPLTLKNEHQFSSNKTRFLGKGLATEADINERRCRFGTSSYLLFFQKELDKLGLWNEDIFKWIIAGDGSFRITLSNIYNVPNDKHLDYLTNPVSKGNNDNHGLVRTGEAYATINNFGKFELTTKQNNSNTIVDIMNNYYPVGTRYTKMFVDGQVAVLVNPTIEDLSKIGSLYTLLSDTYIQQNKGTGIYNHTLNILWNF